MLFWEGLKGRITWLRDILLTPWDIVWAQLRERPLLIASTGIIVAGAFAGVYRYKSDFRDFLHNAQDGKIIVNSPTVYTRQRLVNDRLDQARWLRTQLDATENDRDKDFKIIDQYHSAASTTSIGVGETPTNGTNAPAISANVEATTTAKFRAKNIYREEVRSELTQTELDDRHDISGNTIFRLSFDASIIAGTRRDAIAAVAVTLTHDTTGDSGKAAYATDYREMYQDWIRYFQLQLRKSLSSVPHSLLSNDPYPPLRLLFTEFLTQRVCDLVTGPSNQSWEDTKPCLESEKAQAREAMKKFTETRASRLANTRDDQFTRQVKGYEAQGANLKLPLSDMLSIARRDCALDPNLRSIPLASLFVVNQQGNPAPGSVICPYTDSLKERVHAGILLYNTLVRLRQTGKIKAGQFKETAALAEDGLTCDASTSDCDLRPWMAKCFTADFIKASLNAFALQAPSKQQQIDHFLKLQIVGRDLEDCHLFVTGRISRYETGATSTTAEQERKLLNELIDYLNKAPDAFAYSVTPKNLTENISTAAETRDAYTAILRAPSDNKDLINFLKQKSAQNRALIAHPIIVGFGSATKKTARANGTAPVPPSLDFGWIVAPRSRGDGLYEQIDGQYPLTVFISVPAWWRSVKAEITTCWFTRAALAHLPSAGATANLCPLTDDNDKQVMMVRLPPAIPEISRKLAFDVLQEPSLYDISDQELTIGARGRLLLVGARLWRSTEVTAGAQRASKIAVLPNMEGIMAEFDCVRPPSTLQRVAERTQNGEEHTVTRDWIRVWTSEGVTDGVPVKFVWPPSLLEADTDDKNICPVKSPPP